MKNYGKLTFEVDPSEPNKMFFFLLINELHLHSNSQFKLEDDFQRHIHIFVAAIFTND